MEKIRIIIADDQNLITQSFKILLEKRTDDIIVVGTAKNGLEAYSLYESVKPDIILMDVRMPDMNGVEATKKICEIDSYARIIMLTTFDDDDYIEKAILAGAVGYLLKDISVDELINAIRAVKHGSVLFTSEIAGKIFHKKIAESKLDSTIIPEGYSDTDIQSIATQLSRREMEILRLLVKGYENQEIAEELHFAEQTIKNRVSVIYTKLGVNNRKEARIFTLKAGIIKSDF